MHVMNANRSRPTIIVIRRWIWLGYWLGMFAMTHTPVPPNTLHVPAGGDKVIHFGLFVGLVWLGTRYQLAVGGKLKLGLWIKWCLIYAAYAGADEWLQRFVHRTPSLFDWLADLAGIVITTALLVFIHRRRFQASAQGDVL